MLYEKNIFNLYHLDLVTHLQGQTSQNLALWQFFISEFYIGGHAGC